MSISKGLEGPKKQALILSVLGMLLLAGTIKAYPCSCTWRGPFLSVAVESPLVVHVRVTRHHSGPAPTLEALVVEVLSGGLLDTGLSIQMGDGMHCRPALEGFPIGSEWILALNGPGAKPGKGWALSHCGEYWVRVQGRDVVGSLTGGQTEQRRMPFRELRLRLRYPQGRLEFSGRVAAGQRFIQPFGPGFRFVLEPGATGWEIVIREAGGEENLARLTPPLHFGPNPREIEGWQFSERLPGCPRPYHAGAPPENPRRFIFSPEVGREIDGPQTGRSVTPEDIKNISRFGWGTLDLRRYSLSPEENGCGRLEGIEFAVELEWGWR